MTSSDMLSINNVAAKLGLSVHQLRRWELMFGLEIKRGRGQQRQYREEDMSVLERIKELVEQGWPTSQIRPQLEAEGLLSPKLIGAPPVPGNPEVLQEAIIGLRNFSERRFIDLSKQIDELRQLLISVTLKQELSTDRTSPWQPMASEYVPTPKVMPPQEITIGPQISIDPPKSSPSQSMMGMPPSRVNQIPPGPSQGTSPGTSSGSFPTAFPNTGASPSATTPTSGSSTADFSQRSMLTGSGQAAGESKTPIPDIDQAPKPITDALQRSMSTLDSLFKDQRNTPGLGAAAGEGSTSSAPPSTSSSTSSASLPAAGPAAQPVRYSTIPPLPTTPTTSTTSASQTPAVGSTNPAAAGASAPSSFANQDPGLPSYAVKTEVEAAAVPPSTPATAYTNAPPATQTPGAPATAWDQAFSSTSVDMEAVPSSGLFEDSSAAESTVGQPSPSRPTTPAVSAPAGYADERNPFTTITGTGTSAVDTKPTDSSRPSLMGQTEASGQGFSATSGATSGTFSGQNLSQTGPLPAHTSVESFAPELKDKLIATQSDSTSTDLPRSEPAEAAAPVQPVNQPALPLATGPQVNFGPNVSAPTPQATPQRMDDNFGLGEVTDQNYLTVLGRALDLIGWSDEQADSFSLKTFGVPHWDELGRSQAEKLVAHLVSLLKVQLSQ